MDAPSLPEFVEFLREWRRLPRSREIAPGTELEADLGITGDDGRDLLVATERRFNVTMSSYENGYREAFNLNPNEFLFHSEGIGPDLSALLGGPSPVARTLTAGDLYDAVTRALAGRELI